jgi:uncharacterized membrane protein (DUF106 family)
MTEVLVQIVSFLNVISNFIGQILSVPITRLSGWQSNTIISSVMGVVFLMIYKYTSNQNAIGKVKDNIKAQMLAMKLFKDSVAVTLQAQRRVFKSAFLLLYYSIRPMAVMIVPVLLILAQMALWYQAQPLTVGQESIITMELNDREGFSLSDVSIQTGDACAVVTGPVKVLSQGRVYWKIKTAKSGLHKITFTAGAERVEKELAVGQGFMRVSVNRPGQNWGQILFNPWEKPFTKDSIVKSVSIEYPQRLSWTSGTNWWVVYFFVCSMIAAFILKPFLNVKL